MRRANLRSWGFRGLAALLVAGTIGGAAGWDVPRAEAFGPSTWTVKSYGTATGTATVDGTAITLQTNGYNVWDKADEFTFVSEPAYSPYEDCSTVTITGTIESLADFENANAAAGLMFRDSDAAGSKNVMWRVLPSGGTRFTVRTEDGGFTTNVSGPTLQFPAELKLVRQGTTFTAYYKQNGQWKLHKFATVPMDDTALAGIGAFSVTANPLTARFSDVNIASVNTYTPPNEEYVDTEPAGADLLLRDRFEDGSGTNVPETAINPVWRGVRYACIAQELSGNRVWARQGMNGDVYSGSAGWTDYEASMDVKFDADNAGTNTAQLLVRARSTKLYGDFNYAIGYVGGSKLVLEKTSNGTITRLKEVGTTSVNGGTWRTIKAKVIDNRIEVYVDGQLLITHVDDLLPCLRGAVGFRTVESNVSIDNFVVTKLDDPLGGDYDNWLGGNYNKPAPTQ